MKVHELSREELERMGRAIHAQVRATYRVVGGQCTPDELANDVWVKLFDDGARRLKDFDPEIASITTYVRTIARNVAIDQLRREFPENPDGEGSEGGSGGRKRRIFVDFESVAETADSHSSAQKRLEASDQFEIIDAFLEQRLSKREYLFFKLHVLDGLDYPTCMEIMKATSLASLQNAMSKINRLCREHAAQNEELRDFDAGKQTRSNPPEAAQGRSRSDAQAGPLDGPG